MTEKDLNAAIDTLGDGSFAPLGGEAAVKSVLGLFFRSDIDSHGDGKKDAESISLDFSTVEATIVGLTGAL